MAAYIYLAIAIVAAFLIVATAPKVKSKRPSLEDFSIPRANQGDPIPVVFGQVRITGPTVAWYGDLYSHQKTKNGVKTRTYYLGLHFIPCLGPVDSFLKILASERLAWSGEVTSSSTITVNAPELFGGRNKAGGIQGDLDIAFGESTQTANAYLTSVQGTPQPAYRGVLSVIANRPYVCANTTSIEPWAFEVARFEQGWYGGTCWYPETVRVGNNWSADALIYAPFDDNVYDPVTAGTTEQPITRVYGRGGQLLRAGTSLFTTDGAYVEFTDPLSGAGSMNMPAGREQSLQLTGEYQMGTNGPLGGSMASDLYLDQFFPSRIGVIRCRFRATDIPPTSPKTMLYLLSCGRNINSAAETNWAWALRLYSGSDLKVQFAWLDSGDVYHYCTGSTTINDDEEHEVLVELDASEVRLYVDGVLEATAVDATAIKQITTGDPVQIWAGSINRYSNHVYQGKLDDIIIGPDLTANAGYMNPAHIIYQTLTDPRWGMGLSTAWIDDTSFRAVALTCYNEGLGLCMQWLRQEKCEDFIQHVCDHAALVLRVSPRTGKFQLKAIRADYDPDSLPVLDEGEIVELSSWERVGYGELIGEVAVTYRDVNTGKDGTVSVQNLAVIQAQSGVVSESIDYPGIPTKPLAERVAMRELRARSVPIARAKIKVTRAAWDYLPGDVFKLTWAKLGLSAVIMRVASIDTGTLTEGVITIEAVEDVFGMPDSTYAVSQATGWTEPDYTADAIATQTAMELPRWQVKEAIGAGNVAALDDAAGYGMLLAVQPSGMATGFDLWSQVDAGGYSEVGEGRDFSLTALLNGSITGATTSLTIDASTLDVAAEVGDLVQIGTGATAEIARITGGNLTTTLTVTRGHLDTAPVAWADNTRIWLLPQAGTLDDETIYSDGEVVDYKGLTVTGGDILAIGSSTAESITFDSRILRPIVPGNVSINTEAWPTVLEGTLTVAWAHRNRATHVDTTLQTATGITTEASVTYSAWAINDDDETVYDSTTGLTGTSWSPTVSTSCTLRIELAAVRSGNESWQRQVRTFTYTVTEGLMTESSEYLTTEGSETLLTEA